MTAFRKLMMLEKSKAARTGSLYKLTDLPNLQMKLNKGCQIFHWLSLAYI